MPAYAQQQFDLTTTPSTYYVGTAAIGSLTADPVWTIQRVTVDANGTPTSSMWTTKTAIWDNRTSETYG